MCQQLRRWTGILAPIERWRGRAHHPKRDTTGACASGRTDSAGVDGTRRTSPNADSCSAWRRAAGVEGSGGGGAKAGCSNPKQQVNAPRSNRSPEIKVSRGVVLLVMGGGCHPPVLDWHRVRIEAEAPCPPSASLFEAQHVAQPSALCFFHGHVRASCSHLWPPPWGVRATGALSFFVMWRRTTCTPSDGMVKVQYEHQYVLYVSV